MYRSKPYDDRTCQRPEAHAATDRQALMRRSVLVVASFAALVGTALLGPIQSARADEPNNPAATTLVLMQPDPSQLGSTATITGSLTSTDPGTGSPTGVAGEPVTLQDAATNAVLGSGVTAADGTLSVPLNTTSTSMSIAAAFAGDTNYAPTTSLPVTLSGFKATTSITVRQLPTSLGAPPALFTAHWNINDPRLNSHAPMVGAAVTIYRHVAGHPGFARALTLRTDSAGNVTWKVPNAGTSWYAAGAETAKTEAARSNTLTLGPRPPARSGSGKRIVFSQAAQRVWVMSASNRVLRTYLVSGSLENNLRPGTYRIYNRLTWTTAYNNGAEYLHYYQGFTYGTGPNSVGASIGFHQIPIQNGRPVEPLSGLGRRASAGCVRQAPADATWLWNWASIGTKVVVVAR